MTAGGVYEPYIGAINQGFFVRGFAQGEFNETLYGDRLMR
jgi:hypothetical protein